MAKEGLTEMTSKHRSVGNEGLKPGMRGCSFQAEEAAHAKVLW